MSKDRLPWSSKYKGSLAPAPAELVEACGTSSECVEHLALRQTFSKCPLFSTTSACCIQSFSILSFLMSAFPTSVASVLWEWKLLAFSTKLRTCSMASITLVTAPTCTRLYRLLAFLALGQLSILDIVHVCSLLHSIQVLLCGNFQPCYFHDSS